MIPQVGQVYVANLTLAQVQDQLYSRLGRVYSGVRRGAERHAPDSSSRSPGSGTSRSSSAGDVVRPGRLPDLERRDGPHRAVCRRRPHRQRQLPAGRDPPRRQAGGHARPLRLPAARHQPDRHPAADRRRGLRPGTRRLRVGGRARCCGPPIYELRPSETLRDAIAFAGGFDPSAVQARVTIHRILPPESRGPGGRARVVVAVGADQFSGGVAPAVPMTPGDSVTVLAVADRAARLRHGARQRLGRGRGGLHAGDEAERRDPAGRRAPSPDVYLRPHPGDPHAGRLEPVQLRSAFTDSTGRVRDDLVLEDEDEVRIFSRTTFRARALRRDRGRGAAARAGLPTARG